MGRVPGKKLQPHPDQDPRWVLVDSVLGRVLRLILCWGIAPEALHERLKAAVDKATRSAPSSRPMTQSARAYKEWFAGPEILRLWWQDPDFVDASGQPQKLSFSGPRPNFIELVKRAAKGVDPEDALEELLADRAIQQLEDGRIMIANTSRLVIHAGSSRRAEVGLYAADNLLTTIERNARLSPTTDSLQCEATCLKFDKEQLPRITRHLRQQCLAAIEQTDDWLHQHAVQPGDQPRETVTVAVGVYITVRDPEPTRAAAKPRTRIAHKNRTDR